MKKTAHIISHTHWDREWYLPFERHHMLLIELMDTLINTLENDKNYKSFHLDGQTLILEDYLQVRPENRERLTKLIKEKRIYVGPWFIQQDEFLTSSEANIRNLQYGHEIANEYGEVCKIGYFLDSFGNMGQAPQILKKAGIDTAVFGRGVKPTGFNNQVSDVQGYESPYSEMYWESLDGSKVLAVLLANWYSNGNEIPTDEKEAKKYWDKKLEETQKYASTNHLLYMNGCDHQPVQTNLIEAMKTAQKLYPDVNFVHSNFNDYMKNVRQELKEDITTIIGELRSQETEGWYTLANTASSRIYLKQMNIKCQMLFEKVAEPLSAIAHKEGMNYPYHLFKYGWKLLMENHPHDSICGCSVDSVHREMVTRFEKAENVVRHIIDECTKFIFSKINTKSFEKINKNAIPFVISNTTGFEKTTVTEIILEVKKKYFGQAPLREVINSTKDYKLPKYRIVDKDGKVVEGRVEEMPDKFNYELPKDKFRKPYIAKRVKVILSVVDIPAYGFDTFAIIPVNEEIKNENSMITKGNIIETNRHITKILEDGSLDILDKNTGEKYTNLGIYEDCGDIGNEYIYFMPIDDIPITTKGQKAKIKILEDTSYRAIIEVTNILMIPKSANEILDTEIQEVVEFKDRKAKRSTKLIEMTIKTQYIFEKLSDGIKCIAKFDNTALDHRLRVLFETNRKTNYHYVDSIFEVAKRDTMPSKIWKNPCNAQHQQAFVNVHNESSGLTIANKGLCEYEVLQDDKNTIAITIHRGTRELGDWGVFETPQAQCLGEQTVEFAIFTHGNNEDLIKSYRNSYIYQVEDTNRELEIKDGELYPKYSLFKAKHLGVIPSSLKVNKQNEIITRWFNITDEKEVLEFTEGVLSCYETDLLEEKNLGTTGLKIELGKREILTLNMQIK